MIVYVVTFDDYVSLAESESGEELNLPGEVTRILGVYKTQRHADSAIRLHRAENPGLSLHDYETHCFPVEDW